MRRKYVLLDLQIFDGAAGGDGGAAGAAGTFKPWT